MVVTGKVRFPNGYIYFQDLRLQSKGAGCEVTSCSYSEYSSIRGSYANYCSLFNLVREIGYNYKEIDTACYWRPTDGNEDDVECTENFHFEKHSHCVFDYCAGVQQSLGNV